MKRNEILRICGTNYKEMTKMLLTEADLEAHILAKGTDRNLRIGLKPNLCTCTPADFGATTHPEIVSGILEYLREHGFENIVIVEGSWIGDTTEDAFEYCGYNTLARTYGIPLIDGQKEPSVTIGCAGMKIPVIKAAAEIDYLINLPVLKGHCQTKITCALKNMKGLLPNSEKRHFHQLGLHKPIAHLNAGLSQDFIVTDHICGDEDFEEGGNPVIKNTILASLDPVLTDAYAARVLGYTPDEIPYIPMAEALGVGSADLNTLTLRTISGGADEKTPENRRILNVKYAVEDIDSCSACYAMLIGALEALREEGIAPGPGFKLSIGQGYQGQTGAYGIGNCTALFDHNIPGCPPTEEDIKKALREWLTK